MDARFASIQRTGMVGNSRLNDATGALLLPVELVALQRPSGATHSVRSTRTGLSQPDKHHLRFSHCPESLTGAV